MKKDLNDTMNKIFGNLATGGGHYVIKNVSDSMVYIYKEAFENFKIDCNDSKCRILLSLEDNNIELMNFETIDMYDFGIHVGKLIKGRIDG